MAMAMVEAAGITGGVDTHLDVHVAAALDGIGGLLGVASFPASEAGYRALLEWLGGFGEVDKVGVEGTGSYGAGLARHLAREGVQVVEVDRPDRQERRKRGKSDSTDAVAAARAALSGRATGRPKGGNGPVEEMRVLLVAQRSARHQRIQCLNQIRQLVVGAPEDIRERFRGRPQAGMLKELGALRPTRGADPLAQTTLRTLGNLARRIGVLDQELAEGRQGLGRLVEGVAPPLLELPGVGPLGAATLLVTAGDHPERLRSEAAWAHLCGVAPLPASSGKVRRHRLNRGGNRQANAALHRIVLTRMGHDPRTRAYVARRRGEGRTTGEIMRALKRYVAREVYRHLRRTSD